jgi:hypothetical protein
MFVRIYRETEGHEVLINLDHISLIEVSYSVRGQDGHYMKVPLRGGVDNPAAVRMYRFHVGGEKFLLASSNPSDPVIQALSDIYSKALKGPSKAGDESHDA